MAIYVPIKGN